MVKLHAFLLVLALAGSALASFQPYQGRRRAFGRIRSQPTPSLETHELGDPFERGFGVKESSRKKYLLNARNTFVTLEARQPMSSGTSHGIHLGSKPLPAIPAEVQSSATSHGIHLDSKPLPATPAEVKSGKTSKASNSRPTFINGVLANPHVRTSSAPPPRRPMSGKTSKASGSRPTFINGVLANPHVRTSSMLPPDGRSLVPSRSPSPAHETILPPSLSRLNPRPNEVTKPSSRSPSPEAQHPHPQAYSKNAKGGTSNYSRPSGWAPKVPSTNPTFFGPYADSAP